ncbi:MULTISPECIES: HNH endonuclease [Halomonadaceae]|uniref:HNH endonuclease n=1 Tax=Halomonadaceae TaxID=28256 RepID=UPI000C346F2A|nr:HNH endonuclease signature motif containing protein [Halomonas sp. MES3-P3E]PKG49280.1 HNH endonuclease [Halomonas sp. MES3-P3E]
MKKRRHLPLNGAAWQRLRAQVIAEEPLCRHCLARGVVSPTTDVDHIHNGDGDYSDDNSRENLQGLCHECHSHKTRAEMDGSATLVAGCDASGRPIDPNHHWNR